MRLWGPWGQHCFLHLCISCITCCVFGRCGLLWYLLHEWINEFKRKILLIALPFPIWAQSFNLTEFEIDWVNWQVVLAQGSLNVFVSWTCLASRKAFGSILLWKPGRKGYGRMLTLATVRKVIFQKSWCWPQALPPSSRHCGSRSPVGHGD